ncbi:MAG: bacillithiol biosynthesis cysteine-adding enzyme BshC [Terriglobales bacterium]
MKSECLPFSQIPHTTPLFSDFLSDHSKVRHFYPRSPYFNQWMKQESAAIRYDAARRERVAAILLRQNEGWHASPKTLENIRRFRAGAATAVTGQQVGLLGGPLFSIFKALTAVKLADVATNNGVECVPVFWLATEDHDREEVSRVSLPGPDGALQTIATTTQGLPNAPVGTLKFGDEIQVAVDAATALLGDSEALSSLRACYQPGDTFGTSFARLFAQWFGEWGVILLDASDPELHRVAEPIYRAAIERSGELEEALLARGHELESAGYHQQVKIVASSSLLFSLHKGARVSIHRRSADFVIDQETVSRAQLLTHLASEPQDFSGNVLLRPVVQDYLLPTLAYTGGSAEVAYFAQAAVVYEALLGRVTPVIPRFSATLIEPKPKSLLERYGLAFTDLLGPEPVREKLAAQALSKDLQSAFERAQASTQQSLAAIRQSLERLDKTLVDAANNAESKMLHQLESLHARAARAELRHSEILDRHAALLSNALYPNKVLQEREIAGVYFLARYGSDLLRNLYDSIHPDCVDHQLISL